MKETSEMAGDVSKVATMNEEAQGDGPVGWETDAEWELETRAFNWNPLWSEEETSRLINDLWRQYCFAADPTKTPPSPSQPERGLEVSDKAVEAAARAMEPMAFREEYTATDEFYDLEQEGRAQAIGRARAALLAASSVHPATGFEVKPLEWRVPTDHPSDPDRDDNVYCADGIGGKYAISKKQKVGPERLLWMAHDPFYWIGFNSIPEAKAFAQTDFDRRVRSCLAPQPSFTDSEAAK